MKGNGGWVVAVCVIVLSVAGSATAAKLITGKQVRNGSLTGQDVKNGSLATADLSGSARAALKGNAGPTGPMGAAGAKGEPGSKGDPGKGGLADGASVEAGAGDIELTPGEEFVTVLSMKITTADPGVLLGSGAVEVTMPNTDQETAVISLRVVHNGHAHPIPSTTSVTPGSSQALDISFQCNAMPGAQVVQLQARVTGAPLTIRGRTAHILSAAQGQ